MSEELPDEAFLSNFVLRFKQIWKEIPKEAPVEGKERDFRKSLADHFFEDLLGWKRIEGQGHYVIAEVKDITLYDDKLFPVGIVETKSPDVKELSRKDEKQLEGYLEAVNSAYYGVLTNWHKFWFYEYSTKTGLKDIAKIDVDAVIKKGVFEISQTERTQILELRRLERRRFVELEDPIYFERHYNEIPVIKEKEEGIKLLTENLGKTIEHLTDNITRFFDAYWKRDVQSRSFLKNAFSDWLKVSGKEKDWEDERKKPETIEVFCKETAYVIVGRLLFTSICEDKRITKPLISGMAITRFLKAGINYLDMLNLIYKKIEEYYEHFYKLGIFDWWRLGDIERGTLSEEHRTRQKDLEKELNLHIGDCLKILNRFDFSKVDKDILKDVYQRYLKKEERKRLGEFYTPDEVITYILDAVGYTPSNDIEDKLLLDPACGSGSFLVEAVRRLIRRFEQKGFDLKDPDQTSQVLKEITGHIYGLDINPFACFIAEMNILFQIVDLFEIVRKKDPFYRLDRFKIYSTDSLMPPLSEEQKQEMKLEFVKRINSRAKAFIEDRIEADEIKGKKFDFVVGNPPYVREEKIPHKYKTDVLESSYPEVYHGDNDLCVYFISRGIDWLKEGGIFGYIVSGKFTKTKYGKYVRAFIPLNTKIIQLVDLRGSNVFREATNDPMIVILERAKEPYKGAFNVARVLEDMSGKPEARMDLIIQHIKDHIGEESFNENFWFYKTNQEWILSEIKEETPFKKYVAEWRLSGFKIREILIDIENASNKKLGEIVENIQTGVQTGCDKVYVINKNVLVTENIEAGILKKFLRGEDVRRWTITWDELYLIYPYKKQNEKTVLISEEELQNNFPNTYRYLSKSKEELRSRWGIKIWYELPTVRSISWFESPKIITPDISCENNFTFITSDFYFAKKPVYGFKLKGKTDRNDFLYILGCLNSNILEFYFKQIASYLGRKGYRYQREYLNKLPIKLPQTNEEKEKAKQIVSSVDRILQVSKQTSSLIEKTENFPDPYFSGKGKRLWVAAKAVPKKPKESYRFSEKDLKIEKIKELTDEESYRLRITKDQNIVFRSQEEASYVQMLLRKKKKISKSRLISLEIPVEKELKKIMREYREDMARMKKIKKTINNLEGRINELVYALYSLDSDDKKIIEDYLTKF